MILQDARDALEKTVSDEHRIGPAQGSDIDPRDTVGSRDLTLPVEHGHDRHALGDANA